MQTFDFDKEYILENDRVMLRLLVEDDIETLRHFSIEEPEIWKYNPIKKDGDYFFDYLNGALVAHANKTEYPFIVFDKVQGKYAGVTRFYDVNLPMKRLQIGYTWYGKDFHGTGMNKDCKFLLLQFAFDELGMERVGFAANNTNEKSIAAMKSIGCTVEGIYRSYNENLEGVRIDAIQLSILKNEWENGAKERLRNKLRK